MSTMPQQKPGKSEQSVGTPWEFIRAVEKRFGSELTIDLAADEYNTKAQKFISEEEDSLSQDWSKFTGNLWLNPPYADIEPWVKKASETECLIDCPNCKPNTIYPYPCLECGGILKVPERKILVLIPAAVGTNYFAEHINGKARVYFLRPRLKFEGHKNSYPKDLILAVYGDCPGYECLKWNE